MGKLVWELMGNFSVILLKYLDYFQKECWSTTFLLEARSLRIKWDLSFCQMLSHFDIDLHLPVLPLCQIMVLAHVGLGLIITISWINWWTVFPKRHTLTQILAYAVTSILLEHLWMQSRRHINVIHQDRSGWPVTPACSDHWGHFQTTIPRTH